VQAIENAKSFAVVAAPLVGKEWNGLLAKASKKIEADKSFAESLNGAIAQFRKMPSGDPRKQKPEEVEDAKNKRVALAKQIVETIEQ
jgi:hypothetical protein